MCGLSSWGRCGYGGQFTVAIGWQLQLQVTVWPFLLPVDLSIVCWPTWEGELRPALQGGLGSGLVHRVLARLGRRIAPSTAGRTGQWEVICSYLRLLMNVGFPQVGIGRTSKHAVALHACSRTKRGTGWRMFNTVACASGPWLHADILEFQVALTRQQLVTWACAQISRVPCSDAQDQTQQEQPARLLACWSVGHISRVGTQLQAPQFGRVTLP